MELDVEISIAAPRDRIWGVLTDTAHYGDWDSGFELVEGEIEPGGRLRLVPEGLELQLKVSVAELQPHERMVWRIRYAFRVSGTRTFALTESPDGTTDFRMHEVIPGRAAKKVPDLERRFRRFAEGLKRRAESTI